MGWTGRTFAKDASGSGQGYLEVQGERLWIAMNLAGPTNDVYYTEDGDTFIQDTTWDNSRTIKQLITFQGHLYIISMSYSPDKFSIYRRDDAGWNLVVQSDEDRWVPTSSHTTWASNVDNCMMIPGWEEDGVFSRGRIWRFDGTTLSLDYEAIDDGYKTILAMCFWNGVWYATTDIANDYPGYDARAILKRVAANNWIPDTSYESIGGYGSRRFGGTSTMGLFIKWPEIDPGPVVITRGLHLAPGSDTWVKMDPFVDPTGISSESPVGNHAHFYNYANGGMLVTNRGNDRVYFSRNYPDYDWRSWITFANHRIHDLMEFRGRLYLCADIPASSNYYLYWTTDAEYTFFGGWAGSESLVVDHEYGDTIWLGLYDEDRYPIIQWLDWDFAEFSTSWHYSTGSYVGVQTVERRNTCIAFGCLETGVANNIIVTVTENKGGSWTTDLKTWPADTVTTLEYHPTSGSDLALTRRDNQDWMQTLTQRAPWSDMGDTPFVARSQLRVGDDIWIGSETGGSSVVRLLSGGSGNDWVDKSVGLPNVPINDLEYAS